MRSKKSKINKDKSLQCYKKQEQYFINILNGINEIRQTILNKLDQISNVPACKKKMETFASKHTPKKIHFSHQEQDCNYILTPKTLRYSSKECNQTPTSRKIKQIISTPKSHKYKQMILMTPVKKVQVSLLKPYKSFYTPQSTQKSLKTLKKTANNLIQHDNFLKTISFSEQFSLQKSSAKQYTHANINLMNKMNCQTEQIKPIKKNRCRQDLITHTQSNRDYDKHDCKQMRRQHIRDYISDGKQSQQYPNSKFYNYDDKQTSRQLKTCRAFSINFKSSTDNKQNLIKFTKETTKKPNFSIQNNKITKFPQFNMANIKQKRQNNDQSKQNKTKDNIQQYYKNQINKLQLQNIISILQEQFEACLKQKQQSTSEQKKQLSKRMRMICYEIIQLREKKNMLYDD